jgi:putative oxidoreductase
MIKNLENAVVAFCAKWGITLLRISLGIVYVWFGALKIAGTSPVFTLIETLHPSYPEPMFFMILGVWEVLVGLGFLFGKFLRTTLVLMWAQMGGIMIGLVTDPHLFFQAASPLSLTYDGEFLIKNLVLIAASLVIAGYGLKPRAKA